MRRVVGMRREYTAAARLSRAAGGGVITRAMTIDDGVAMVSGELDFRVIAGAGHWVVYEAADQVNAAILDMLID
jgi:pimeloyl-ACP methyl ester carboxylesterase